MVLSGPKRTTNIQSIINRPNCGGGAKKSGLSRGIGPINKFNPNNIGGVNTLYGINCVPSMTIQTQNYGYRATLSNGMG